jgi:ribosome biogenesis GTPase
MKLSDIGFDQWFQEHVSDLRQDGHGVARISAVDRGSYLIRNELGEIPAELAGKFYFQVESSVDLPCVGDWVTVQYHNDAAWIVSITLRHWPEEFIVAILRSLPVWAD